MGNIIFSLTLAVLSLHFFTITYRLNGVNRMLYNIPISIFESSIPLAQESEEIVIYYNKTELQNKLTYYFDTNIHKYVSRYTLDFYYYNQSDGSICKSDYCDAVGITLKAEILLTVNYQKTATFYIKDNR